MKPQQEQFCNLVAKEFPGVKVINRDNINTLMAKYPMVWPSWLTGDKQYREGRGVFRVPAGNASAFDRDILCSKSKRGGTRTATVKSRKVKEKLAPVAENVDLSGMVAKAVEPEMTNTLTTVGCIKTTEGIGETISLVPQVDPEYVAWGHHEDIFRLVASKVFYPTFITGMSGNGKTYTCQQACAQADREFIRVNLTRQTDEDDLLGGFRLVNGETVWHDGPVIEAMKRGAVLLLDEIDLATERVMCLQPVLEGNGIFLKKIGRMVYPAPGFQILATANTKGKGNDDGRFIGTNTLNEAFLDRFAITYEQPYPNNKTEKKILTKVATRLNNVAEDFIDCLTKWAGIIRDGFKEGAGNEIISTRRLVRIYEAFSIFGNDRKKAIHLCTARFDDETQQGFWDLYEKCDPTLQPVVETPVEEETTAKTSGYGADDLIKVFMN